MLEAVDLDVARVVVRADDKHAGRVAGRVDQLDRTGRRKDVEVSRDRRLLADDRLDPQRLLVVKHQPAAHVQLEVHVEVARGVAGGKRVQVQPVRRVVDKLLDLAERRLVRVQRQGHHAVGQIHGDQLRLHLVQQVAVVVHCVAHVRALEEDVRGGGAT